MTRYDVVVVGGGPSGASAAFNLARQNLRLALIEAKQIPRYKTCGGGVTYRARRHLPDGLLDSAERYFHTVEMNFIKMGQSLCATRDKPIITMVMRDRFDADFVKKAEEAGADIYHPCKLSHIDFKDTELICKTSKGEITASYVVGADGALSRVADLGGWPKLSRVVPALELEVFTDQATYDRFSERPRFDFEVFFDGYGWVFPKKNHLSIGIGRFRPRGGEEVNLKKVLDQYIDVLNIRDQIEHVEEHGYVIPLKPRSKKLCGKRILLVGDAAGLADPYTGEGISQAIISGKAAANALVAGGSNPKKVYQCFQHEMEKELLSELRIGRFFAKILYGNPKVREWFFKRFGGSAVQRVTDILMGDLTANDILFRPTVYRRLFERAFTR